MAYAPSRLSFQSLHRALALLILSILMVISGQSAHAQAFATLHSFPSGDQDGREPSRGSLLLDTRGNLYGTTWFGGAGFGTVFELSPSLGGWTERLVYFFDPGPGGDSSNLYPWYPSGLVMDSDSNLYGTTAGGGKYGAGVVFEINPSGQAHAVYDFIGGADGAQPADQSLALDELGNLYGVTIGGGAYGQGVVFTVTPAGLEQVLYSFTGGADGGIPQGNLIRDAAGNLYGTTVQGGLIKKCLHFGCGTVYRLAPDGTQTVLYAFRGPKTDGKVPNGGLVMDAQGDLYGTTYRGGIYNQGTVFKVTPAGVETLLHSFAGSARADGAQPFGNLARDSQGNLYGVTGGGFGRIFEITASGTEKLLYKFTKKSGCYPPAGLALGTDGSLYGITYSCGANAFGTVYSLHP